MSIDDNKAITRRYIEEVWNQGNMSSIGEFIAPNHVGHRPGKDIEGLAAFKDWVTSNRNAFPDIHFKIQSQIAEEDMVVTTWTLTGTHKGEFMGIAATGEKLTAFGVSIARLSGGKHVESWVYWDPLSILHQLGAI